MIRQEGGNGVHTVSAIDSRSRGLKVLESVYISTSFRCCTEVAYLEGAEITSGMGRPITLSLLQ